jgi:hypothetical protein
MGFAAATRPRAIAHIGCLFSDLVDPIRLSFLRPRLIRNFPARRRVLP